jgi:hypothetical protein
VFDNIPPQFLNIVEDTTTVFEFSYLALCQLFAGTTRMLEQKERKRKPAAQPARTHVQRGIATLPFVASGIHFTDAELVCLIIAHAK